MSGWARHQSRRESAPGTIGVVRGDDDEIERRPEAGEADALKLVGVAVEVAQEGAAGAHLAGSRDWG